MITTDTDNIQVKLAPARRVDIQKANIDKSKGITDDMLRSMFSQALQSHMNDMTNNQLLDFNFDQSRVTITFESDI